MTCNECVDQIVLVARKDTAFIRMLAISILKKNEYLALYYHELHKGQR